MDDENQDQTNRVPSIQGMMVELPQIRDRDFRQRTAQINRTLEDFNRFFVNGSKEAGVELAKFQQPRIDPKPFVVTASDWTLLERASKERFEVYRAFLRDLSGAKSVLLDGDLPSAIPYEDPGFLMQANHLPNNDQWGIVSMDWVRISDWEWRCVDQNFSNPWGLARLIQTRRLIAQYFPEYFNAIDPEPVSGIPAELMERLKKAGKTISGDSEPFVAIFARVSSGLDSFEDGFLARFMGVPLVESSDLIVRDQCLFIRTIDGLKRVHVLLNKRNGKGLDPVTFGKGHEDGVPGLIHCVRAGNLILVYPLGSEIANNRQLGAYENALYRRFKNQRPSIKRLTTFVSGRYDQWEEIQTNAEKYIVIKAKDGEDSDSEESVVNAKLSGVSLVAHPRESFDELEVFDGKNLVERPYRIRLFLIGGEKPRMVPGGLVFLSNDEMADSIVRQDRWPIIKDFWVSRNQSHSEKLERLEPLELSLESESLALSSRLAENLYWLGRYMERAENTARLVNIYTEAKRDVRNSQPSGFLDACLESAGIEIAGSDERMNNLEIYLPAIKLLADSGFSGSVSHDLHSAQRICGQLSGTISPEYLRALSRITQILNRFDSRKRMPPAEIERLSAELIDQLISISGVASRTFSRDQGWFFYRAGSLLERIVFVLNLILKVLPSADENFERFRLDDSDLIYLLRITVSLDAYHRDYRSRAFLDRILHLLLKSDRAPNGVMRCVEELDLGLKRHVVIHERMKSGRGLIKSIKSSLEELQVDQYLHWRGIDLKGSGFVKSASISELVEEIETYLKRINRFHEQLESKFFYHQVKPKSIGFES